ncbi:hypothetical protein BKA62DRAFT_696841 [Auriculariales sp. MPI-PUGE-AT-0066]|nr:hypothetical protein BKA62DRAFT_696841 [Auriculariales sp. MPI-PUGE-AT-0066]
MATIYDRNEVRDFSGLENQAIAAACILTTCVSIFEVLRRKRRGRGLKQRPDDDPLGSVETWEFGYLYQGRSWAEKPSPPHSRMILGWVWQVLAFPEDKMLALVGTDATLYCRFLRGAFYFVLLHSLTTMPILLPIHIVFSPDNVEISNIIRGSIASMVQGGPTARKLLGIHVVLMLWVTVSWVAILFWICQGAFRFRESTIRAAAAEFALEDQDLQGPPPATRGIRLRTILVSNIPRELRTEKQLREYFEYYLSRPHEPSGNASSVSRFVIYIGQLISWGFRKLFRKAEHEEQRAIDPPVIEKVVVMRKMDDLASLLERREDVLRKLEASHINLAKRILNGVKDHLSVQGKKLILEPKPVRKSVLKRRIKEPDVEAEAMGAAGMKKLVTTLAPFVEQFAINNPQDRQDHMSAYATVWDALYALPRSTLHPYQPLVNLKSLFSGATVPAIDYFTAKLGLLSALVHEKRSRQHEEFEAASTAFVTFATPADAQHALESLPTHPRSPVECIAVLAPDYEDLDWHRVMKRSMKAEFVTDWIVNLGVWTFTCSWIFPVSLFVSLFNLNSIAGRIPILNDYMKKHPDTETALSSLLPTVLVSLLQIFIPMLLLLIGKKAHTIITLSKLHDRIMTRYHKFLLCNVVIFFCVGVATLESFLTTFRTDANLIPLISKSFSTAGPFYIGWCRCLCDTKCVGLPLLVYPGTRAAATLRRREAGTRPRTFNYYYWLPNHVLCMSVVFLFACVTPLVLPFAVLYFAVECVIIKNQLLHVYSKKYENDGKINLIRWVRYSLDGCMFAQVVLLAFMVLQKKPAHAIALGVFVLLTAATKIYMTRRIRTLFQRADNFEAEVHCGVLVKDDTEDAVPEEKEITAEDLEASGIGVPMPREPPASRPSLQFLTWRLPAGVNFSYSSLPVRSHVRQAAPAKPNPFRNTHNQLRDQRVQSPNVAEWRKTIGPVTMPSEREEPKTVVSVHPKKAPWDDRPRLDRPYINPYYATALDNFLWLPCNPFGPLDLDDSIDMHRALTSEIHTGRLGVWLNDAPTVAGAVVTLEPSRILSDGGGTAKSAEIESSSSSEGLETGTITRSTIRREISGRETIVGLPEEIARRAQYERDIEEAEGAHLTVGKGGTIKLRATPQAASSREEGHARPRVFREIDTSPGAQATPDSIISARDAVMGEILVEEQLASEARLRKEQAEQTATTSLLWKWTRG